MSKLRVVIVEDEPDIRNGYVFLINNTSDFICTGYDTAEDAIKNILNDAPQVIIMDVNLPGMNGIDATSAIKLRFPAIQILMFTVYENNANVFDALAAGASGYILKQSPPEKLLEAIREVMTGGAPMSSQVARMVVGSFRKSNSMVPEAGLTEREEEILKLLADGYRNQEVAEKLFVSLSTVKTHVYNIYAKLHVKSRVEAINKLMGK